MSSHLHIFRTDVKTPKKVKVIKPVFNHHPHIKKWSVDTEDIDNVLKVEAATHLSEQDIIVLMKTCGFYCAALGD